MSCNENTNMCVLKLSEVEDTITSSNKSIMVIHCEIVPFKLIKNKNLTIKCVLRDNIYNTYYSLNLQQLHHKISLNNLPKTPFTVKCNGFLFRNFPANLRISFNW